MSYLYFNTSSINIQDTTLSNSNFKRAQTWNNNSIQFQGKTKKSAAFPK